MPRVHLPWETLAKRRCHRMKLCFLSFPAGVRMSEFSNESPFDGRANPSSAPRRWPIVEIVAAILVVLLLVWALLPAVQRGGYSVRGHCNNNLKQIITAMHMYHEKYGEFPPAYTIDANGKRLHSWRTLILPYLDERDLYSVIDLSRPWDDAANAASLKKAPAIFRCPNFKGSATSTSYLAIVSPCSCLRGGRSVSAAEISDGLSETILVFEAPQDHAVHWMSPNDADEQLFLSISSSSKLTHASGFNAVMADGHVTFIHAELSEKIRKALITVDGGEGHQVY